MPKSDVDATKLIQNIGRVFGYDRIDTLKMYRHFGMRAHQDGRTQIVEEGLWLLQQAA